METKYAWIAQHESEVWNIVAKISARCPDLFATHTASEDGIEDVSSVLGHIRAVWYEGITDDEWFASAVRLLEETPF
jgi:hypothetical protein